MCTDKPIGVKERKESIDKSSVKHVKERQALRSDDGQVCQGPVSQVETSKGKSPWSSGGLPLRFSWVKN